MEENKKVTYATPTLMEYVAIIKMGKATLRVPFSGGTITAYGVNPATFTTSNPIYQRAIESSEPYLNGRIVKLSEVALSGAPKIKLEHNEEKAQAPSAEVPEQQTESESASEDEQVADEPTEESEQSEEVPEAESDAELTKVTVTCLEDAAAYLKENFGVANRQVRSKASAEKIGKANGVEFVWE
jgi:hypothetical protein